MPSPKEHGPIETMRAIAWCAEVQRESGLTTNELKKQGFEGSSAPKLEFSLFAKGGRLPKEETLELVESSYPGTRAVFDVGPEKLPLWELLAEECDEDLCLRVIDDWLFAGFRQSDMASVPESERNFIISQLKSSPFKVKTEVAWKKMVGSAEVCFELFDAGKERHCMWEPAAELRAFLAELKQSGIQFGTPQDIPTLLRSPSLDENQKEELKGLSDYFDATYPTLEDVVGIIALRRLAESRREYQSQARYLFRGMLIFVDGLFSEWNIGTKLDEFLSPWSRVPTSPSAIAAANITTAEVVKILREEKRKKLPTKEANVISAMLHRFKR